MARVVLAAGAAFAALLPAAAPHWRPLPAAPIHGRIAASAVWTGAKLIVWGGTSRAHGSGQPRADGATYNPATRTWRAIAPAPAGVAGGYGAAAWTPEGMVVFASNSPDGPVGAALYDLRANTWRRLPPGPLGFRESYASAWTGSELLVVGGSSGDTLATPTAAALDPAIGRWRVLKAFAKLRGLMPAGAVWTGRRLLVAGTPRGGHETLVAYDPRAGSLRRAALPEGDLTLVGWTGSRAVFAVQQTRLLLYDPAARTWAHAGDAPCALPTHGYSQSVWIGTRFVAACGSDRLQVYTPRTNHWRVIAAGRSPLNELSWGVVAWTGRLLIAWSGTARKPFNPTPATGASIVLSP